MSSTTASSRRKFRRSALPFAAFHFVPLLAVFTGVTMKALVLGFVLYLVRMMAITAGYHRYFSHRTYKMSRGMAAVVAFIGTMAVQRGPLFWAGHHRTHHKYADTDRDPHSPKRGFWWSHIGWVLSGDYSFTNYEAVPDLMEFPELRWLDKHDWVGPWALAIACTIYAGWPGLLIGFFASTLVTMHVTFAINSVAHVFGRRRYATSDTSRNSFLLALVTLGEGWHNNHHHYPRSVRQGFLWWQVDPAFMVLRACGWLHIVRDLQYPTDAARRARLIRAGSFDVGRFRQYLAGAERTLPDDAGPLRELLETVKDEAAALTTTRRGSSRAAAAAAASVDLPSY